METATNTKWAIDPTHSEITFKVKHLVISTVTGKFNEFSGSLTQTGENLENAQIEFQAKIDSISTGVADRDNHLKSDDFFNAAEYPEMKFAGKSFNKTGEDTYQLVGDLTIRDVTKEVALDVTHGGTVVDPYGQTKAGFEIEGKINRKDFNLSWSALTETGAVVVSEEVKLALNVQLVAQQ
ncbi:MAG: YceI family protein [Cyclobacteriaceae bacterium]